MNKSSFTSSPDNRYFEDYIAGSAHEFGSIVVEEKEVIDFGKRFVPLPYHVDPEAAKKSIYGGLIASGWQTATSYMRRLVDGIMLESASLGSPGIDELRWLRPVRPGDVLRLRVTVLEATRSRSRLDRGVVRSLMEVLNQDGEVVMSLKPMNIIASRSAS